MSIIIPEYSFNELIIYKCNEVYHGNDNNDNNGIQIFLKDIPKGIKGPHKVYFDKTKIYNNFQYIFNKYKLDLIEFSKALQSNKGIISGSMVLSCITGDFIGNDIDIYIPLSNYISFKKYLYNILKKSKSKNRDIDYQLYIDIQIKENREFLYQYFDEVINEKIVINKHNLYEIYHFPDNINEDHIIDNINSTDYPDINIDIQFIEKITISNPYSYKMGKTIDIIVTKDNPLNSIKKYDLSVLCNWFDGNNIHISYLDNIINKYSLLNENILKNHNKYSNMDRCNKYTNRGFKMVLKKFNKKNIDTPDYKIEIIDDLLKLKNIKKEINVQIEMSPPCKLLLNGGIQFREILNTW